MKKLNSSIFNVLQTELFPVFQTKASAIPQDYKEFFGERDYKEFLSIICRFCDEHNIRLDQNTGIARLEEFGLEVKLKEIARDCSEYDKELWRFVISSYFINKPGKPARIVNRVVKARFNQVAPYLSIKVYPEAYLSTVTFDEFMSGRIWKILFLFLLLIIPIQ